MRVTAHWKVIYPSNHNKYPHKTRTVTLISTKIVSDKALQIKVYLLDITAIMINTSLGRTDIYNIYLDGTHANEITLLTNTIDERQNLLHIRRPKHMIWAGDFNRHHPLWDENRNKHLFTHENLTKAQIIIDMQVKYNMSQVLPKGIPMLIATNSGNHTRPDNVFVSERLENQVLLRLATSDRLT